ncbi:GNAT family N-acetyltransferase [Corynebacterium sp. HMSC05E07]|uniref:GNAT family N-acetyltransferase n=1 Tax=Corynebacterium sp. HMSC05E07 TaxID=1581117 RepID=UPI0008A140D1|nr:GNAT family N-acetyltransferase [Corynebacterium sp. HMSC05E07]OFT62301.1 hypothetical protein HMPREF3149_04300 [Corynebacterium sp. HMSC05E07]
MTVKSVEDMWAPFKLSLQVGDLTLRVLRDGDIAAIHGVTAAEIFGEPLPEYTFPWLKEKPDPSFRWAHRAQMSPEEWSLDFGVHLDGEVIGSVDLRAQNFPDNHEVETGSWIYRRFQGRGIGTKIRHAAAVFCFEYLGARQLRSEWDPGNEASQAVSRKLHYSIEGNKAVLRKEDYHPGPEVTVSGMTEELGAMLGVRCPK